MSDEPAPVDRARVDRIVANGIHELYRTHPETAHVNAQLVAAIFRAGVVAGATAMREVTR